MQKSTLGNVIVIYSLNEEFLFLWLFMYSRERFVVSCNDRNIKSQVEINSNRKIVQVN